MKRMLLALDNGAIVQTPDGRWGVLCLGHNGSTGRRGFRIVDFWDGGLEYVRDRVVVEVA